MTSHILMIEPVAFGFNAETAANNYFQKNDDKSEDYIQRMAYAEFQNMKSLLTNKGINVISIPDTLHPHTPDSIFPNNWISFHEDARVALYPMFAPNRRSERRYDILEQLSSKGFVLNDIVDYTFFENKGSYLEGTGSMIFDRKAKIAYAALSERTDETIFKGFCHDFGFTPCTFHALQSVDGKRLPIYHTNVMMCVADKYAVVCFDSIDDADEREHLRQTLLQSGKEIIVELTEAQIHQFAGNMLQVQGQDDTPYLVLSQTAFDALTAGQKDILGKYNELIPVDIATIEQYGGGSARCMMAEIYNPINQ